jgi:small redox-active disulfide protein 2
VLTAKRGQPQVRLEKPEERMKVEILGVGCAKCHKLEDMVREMVKKHDIDADVVKVEDIKTFGNYGVFMTPALVVDGEVKVAGKIPKESEILEWLSA